MVEIRGIEADVTRHVPTIAGWTSVEYGGGREASRPYDSRVDVSGIWWRT
ncbi:MAG: hypothetical protein ACI30S_07070 [Muribaculaceae bacterium]